MLPDIEDDHKVLFGQIGLINYPVGYLRGKEGKLSRLHGVDLFPSGKMDLPLQRIVDLTGGVGVGEFRRGFVVALHIVDHQLKGVGGDLGDKRIIIGALLLPVHWIISRLSV